MKIQWLGHSAFRLEESTGTAIVTDPYNNDVGFEMPAQTADAVTLSNPQKDHTSLKHIKGNPEIIKSLGAFEVKGIHVQSIRSYAHAGKKRGENIIYKFRIDGVEVCHLGNIGEECNIRIVESVMPVNVLLIPVGGGLMTIDAAEAREYVDKIMPDIVIPMHYKTKDSALDIDKVNEFLELFDEEDIVYCNSDTIYFDRSDFDGEKTKVIVLEKQSL
ncbi:MAG: MBL fold metallo-hydrolase [Clostridiales bacterium]|nr:MBL fold metallo-hydrolase [Clostridiales bacterium]